MDKFGSYFRPAGMSARTGDPVKASTPNPTPVTPKVETTTEAVAEETVAPSTDNNKAEDILKMIRSRQSQ